MKKENFLEFSSIFFNAEHHVCKKCKSKVEVHQPDVSNCDRFLATCPCGVWYIIDLISSDSGKAIESVLPEQRTFIDNF